MKHLVWSHGLSERLQVDNAAVALEGPALRSLKDVQALFFSLFNMVVVWFSVVQFLVVWWLLFDCCRACLCFFAYSCFFFKFRITLLNAPNIWLAWTKQHRISGDAGHLERIYDRPGTTTQSRAFSKTSCHRPLVDELMADIVIMWKSCSCVLWPSWLVSDPQLTKMLAARDRFDLPPDGCWSSSKWTTWCTRARPLSAFLPPSWNMDSAWYTGGLTWFRSVHTWKWEALLHRS